MSKNTAIKKPNKLRHGFTIPEVVLTVAALGLFIYSSYQIYRVLETQRWNILRQGIASDIAYTNLKKFPARPTALTSGTCSTSINIGTATYNFSPEPTTAQSYYIDGHIVLSTVTQTVTAYPVDGCSGSNYVTQTLKIVSTVTYKGGSVSHATFVQ